MYDAFRMPLYLPHPSGKAGQPIEVWGDARPAHYAITGHKGSQVVSIQFKPATGGGWKTIQSVTLADAYGYFDVHVKFPSSGSVRTAWTQPGTGQLYSRVAPVTTS
jgi:hypothetical protein